MNIKLKNSSILWSVSVTLPPKTPLPDGFEIHHNYYGGSSGTMNCRLNVVADTFEEALERTRNILPTCTFVGVSKGQQIHLP